MSYRSSSGGNDFGLNNQHTHKEFDSQKISRGKVDEYVRESDKRQTTWNTRSIKRRKRHVLPGPIGLARHLNHGSSTQDSQEEDIAGTKINNSSQSAKDRISYNHAALQVTHHPAWLQMCISLERYVVLSPNSSPTSVREVVFSEYTLLSEVISKDLLRVPLMAAMITTTPSLNDVPSLQGLSVSHTATDSFRSTFTTKRETSALVACHVMDESGMTLLAWAVESIFQQPGDHSMRSDKLVIGMQYGMIVALLKDVPVIVLPQNESEQNHEVKVHPILVISNDNLIYKWTEEESSYDDSSNLTLVASSQTASLNFIRKLCVFRTETAAPTTNPIFPEPPTKISSSNSSTPFIRSEVLHTPPHGNVTQPLDLNKAHNASLYNSLGSTIQSEVEREHLLHESEFCVSQSGFLFEREETCLDNQSPSKSSMQLLERRSISSQSQYHNAQIPGAFSGTTKLDFPTHRPSITLNNSQSPRIFTSSTPIFYHDLQSQHTVQHIRQEAVCHSNQHESPDFPSISSFERKHDNLELTAGSEKEDIAEQATLFDNHALPCQLFSVNADLDDVDIGDLSD